MPSPRGLPEYLKPNSRRRPGDGKWHVLTWCDKDGVPLTSVDDVRVMRCTYRFPHDQEFEARAFALAWNGVFKGLMYD